MSLDPDSYNIYIYIYIKIICVSYNHVSINLYSLEDPHGQYHLEEEMQEQQVKVQQIAKSLDHLLTYPHSLECFKTKV